MGIKGKYVRKLKSSIQRLGLLTAEKEIIFCNDCFINSNKALRPIDLLCKSWSCKLELPTDSLASFSVCLNPLVLPRRHTLHLPLTVVKFCLNFFCYLWC